MSVEIKGKTFFAYEGRINNEILAALLTQLKNMAQFLDLTEEHLTRLSMVLIEQCHNIMKYGERNGNPQPMPDGERPGSVVFGRDSGGLFVSTACYIKPSDSNALASRYEHIRSLPLGRLEEEYRWHRDSGRQYSASNQSQAVGMGLLATARFADLDKDGKRQIDFVMEAANRAKTTVHVMH